MVFQNFQNPVKSDLNKRLKHALRVWTPTKIELDLTHGQIAHTHSLPGLFSHQHEVIHHMFGQTFELLPQHWVLCCNAHRAGIEMTLSHHDASHSNQWCLTSFGGALGCLQGTKITSGIQIMQGSVWWDLFIAKLQKLIECINSLNSLDWFESRPK